MLRTMETIEKHLQIPSNHIQEYKIKKKKKNKALYSTTCFLIFSMR